MNKKQMQQKRGPTEEQLRAWREMTMRQPAGPWAISKVDGCGPVLEVLWPAGELVFEVHLPGADMEDPPPPLAVGLGTMANFIVMCREAVPALIDEVGRLRTLLTVANMQLERRRTRGPQRCPDEVAIERGEQEADGG